MSPEINLLHKIVGKYSLVGPVEDGNQYWTINDLEKMYSLVSISTSYPKAEEIANFLFNELTRGL